MDARLGAAGLVARRPWLRRSFSHGPAMIVVDSGHLPRTVIERRLRQPDLRVAWIRRGLFRPDQAAIQAGYLPFADLVVVPDEGISEANDTIAAMAADQGKLHHVGVVHAYQAMPARAGTRKRRAFLALGAYTPKHRPAYQALRRHLEVRNIPYVWSAHDRAPLADGFAAHRAVPVRKALLEKSRSTAIAGEAGYNSVYEGLHLGLPMLLFANETEGREAQQVRVAIARELSGNVFDAANPEAIGAWLERAALPVTPIYTPPAVAESNGLRNMADLIERMFDVATPRTH
jgi:hypothetical protein